MAVIVPANRLGTLIAVAVSSVLASTVLYGLDVRVAGLHLGRIDSIFLAGGLLTILGGVVFALMMRGFRTGSAAEEPVEVGVA